MLMNRTLCVKVRVRSKNGVCYSTLNSMHGNASLYLSKQIKKLSHRYFKLTPNTITFAYSTFKTKNIFSYKDKLPDVLRASVVYKFQCGGCNSIYVGQTGRHLRTRASEHLGKSSSTGLPYMTNSTVFDHISKTGHQAII